MNKVKVVIAGKQHREFLIKSNAIIHQTSEQEYESGFAKRLDDDYYCKSPKFFCLVAEYDKKPVGMILYSKMYWADDGEVLLVSQMYVDKDYRKFGIANELYRALKDHNPEANVISCATAKSNNTMNRILKGMGFNVVDMNFFAKRIR